MSVVWLADVWRIYLRNVFTATRYLIHNFSIGVPYHGMGLQVCHISTSFLPTWYFSKLLQPSHFCIWPLFLPFSSLCLHTSYYKVLFSDMHMSEIFRTSIIYACSCRLKTSDYDGWPSIWPSSIWTASFSMESGGAAYFSIRTDGDKEYVGRIFGRPKYRTSCWG